MKTPLNKLFPKESFLKLNRLEHQLKINTITLSDEAWLSHEFGDREQLAEVFYSGDIRSIIRIIYRLMDEESKKLVSNIQLTTTDEDGNQANVKSNIDKMLYLASADDLPQMIKCLIDSRGASMPPELIDDEQAPKDAKKKIKTKK